MFRRICVLSSLPLVWFAAVVPIATASPLESTISVQGEAVRKVANDTAGLGFSVSKVRGSKGAALHIVAIRLRAVIAAVQAVPGVGAGGVTTTPISVRRTRGGKAMWRATEGIAVVLHEPKRAGQAVNAGVGAGATGTSGPRFFLGDREAAYEVALLAAFDQAKAKAMSLAVHAGAVLGPAITIEEPRAEVVEGGSFMGGSFEEGAGQPAEARLPTKPGSSTVTATVRVVFALE